MNINPILAILVLKNIITHDEAEKVAEFVHDKPQSTILSDTINQIKEFIPMSQQPLTGGPEQQAEELAARERLAEEQRRAAEEAEAAEETDAEETSDKPAEENANTSDAKAAKK